MELIAGSNLSKTKKVNPSCKVEIVYSRTIGFNSS